MTDQTVPDTDDGMLLAVVGMAGRFPKVTGLRELWDAVADGTDLLTRYPARPDGTVPAFGAVAEADRFDAPFFGISAQEAKAMDPQHRVFLECAWEALEHAGHDPARFEGHIGVYGGPAETDHRAALRANPEALAGLSLEEREFAGDLSYLTARVSYNLGLTGPCVTVLAHCASSLLAVHTAGQALLGGECDLAVAGGVSMMVPHPDDIDSGNGIASDGHVRTFDARADGVVVSNAAAVVTLRRLEDAIADGDTVHAVIRGSAVNNDGNRKNRVGTPSTEALAEVMRDAHQVAEVDPATIDYVEATYGASREVGNPIEMAALRKVFGPPDPKRQKRCRLGSVMSHVGHTESVCGAMALLILIQGLRHGRMPGTAHFQQPDPELDLDSGPFEVSAQTAPWPAATSPRRAAITSVGRGGTNVHMVIEEAPPVPSRKPDGRYALLPVSARDRLARDAAVRRLTDDLSRARQPLDDVAWTLQMGRKAFEYRGFVVADVDGTSPLPHELVTGVVPASPSVTDFLCADDDPSALPSTASLYENEPAFKAAFDECFEGPRAAPKDDRSRLVAVQYGLGRLFQDWGIRPSRIVSDGIGDFAAAALSGVISPAEAVALALGQSMTLTPVVAEPVTWISTRTGNTVAPGEATSSSWWTNGRGQQTSLERAVSTADHALLGLGTTNVTPTLPVPLTTSIARHTETAKSVLAAVGQLWLRGADIDWPRMHSGRLRRRVPLPTYPFARRRFRLDDAFATPAKNATTSPRWLLTRDQRPEADLRLYCFPHSGGAAGEYMMLSPWLSNTEVWGLQLPGRGSRLTEPPVTSLTALAEAIVSEVEFKPPFIFFGHSFGALLAFEVARRLRDKNARSPQRLIVSACAAPEDTAPPSRNPVYSRDDTEFVAEIERRYGNLPQVIHDDPQLRSIMLPSLRADMEAAEEYRFTPGEAPACPITALGGHSDDIDETKLRRWSQHSAGDFQMRMFTGGHFYFREHPNDFMTYLSEELNSTDRNAP